jgi:hypothetical protein
LFTLRSFKFSEKPDRVEFRELCILKLIARLHKQPKGSESSESINNTATIKSRRSCINWSSSNWFLWWLLQRKDDRWAHLRNQTRVPPPKAYKVGLSNEECFSSMSSTNKESLCSEPASQVVMIAIQMLIVERELADCWQKSLESHFARLLGCHFH